MKIILQSPQSLHIVTHSWKTIRTGMRFDLELSERKWKLKVIWDGDFDYDFTWSWLSNETLCRFDDGAIEVVRLD